MNEHTIGQNNISVQLLKRVGEESRGGERVKDRKEAGHKKRGGDGSERERERQRREQAMLRMRRGEDVGAIYVELCS